MKVKDVMTRTVSTIWSDATLQEAAGKMRSESVRFLPVIDDMGLCGAITEHDIAVRSTALGMDPTKVKVREVMTRHPAAASENQALNAACDLMAAQNIRHLIVVNVDGDVCGVLTPGDIVMKTGVAGPPDETYSGSEKARTTAA
jgi:CBS domain-containing protein